MTPAEEDALVNDYLDQWSSGRTALISLFRLAIRAAYARGVAEERERAARVADEHAKRNFTWGSENSDRYHAQADWAERIAAAIRRGES